MAAKRVQDPDGPSPAKARQLALEKAARSRAKAQAPMNAAVEKAEERARKAATARGATPNKTTQLVREAGATARKAYAEKAKKKT